MKPTDSKVGIKNKEYMIDPVLVHYLEKSNDTLLPLHQIKDNLNTERYRHLLKYKVVEYLEYVTNLCTKYVFSVR